MDTRIAFFFALFFATHAHAESYDFEFEGSYSQTRSETVSPLFIGATDRIRSEIDVDALSFGLTWFPDALDINGQLRPEAAFLTRTSSVALSYTRTDADVRVTDSFASNLSDMFTTDALAVAGRYVWADSGWFIDGGLDRTDFEDTSTTTLVAGFGRYIASNTTVGLALGRTETDFGGGTSSSSGAILSGKHVGGLTGQWQYGVEATVSNIAFAGADGRYTAEFSLYPSQDVVFGIQTTGPIGSDGDDARNYVLRAGWFIRPALELSGGYQWTSFDDNDFVEQDTDGLSLGVRYRF